MKWNKNIYLISIFYQKYTFYFHLILTVIINNIYYRLIFSIV